MEMDLKASDPVFGFHPIRLLMLTTLFSVLVYFLVEEMVKSFEAPNRITFWGAKFSILNIFIAIAFFAISLSTRRPQPNMAFFWIFQLVFFGIGGLVGQMDPFPYYLTQTSDPKTLLSTSQLIFLAQVAVCAGQIIALAKVNMSSQFSNERNSLDLALLVRRVRVMMLIYLVISPVIIVQLGGSAFLLKRVRFSDSSQNLTISLDAIYKSFLYVPPLLAILTLLFVNRYRKVNRLALTSLVIWILFLSNPLGNARQTTLFLVLPLIFVALQGRIKLTLVFYSLLPIVFLYSAKLVNRYSGQLQKPQLSIVSRDGDFDSFSQVANGLQMTADGHFPILRQITASLLFFVPRSVFHNKPNDTGVELARLVGLKFQNLSAPWILEAFVNFRAPGVLFIAVGLGFYLTKVDLHSNLDLRSFLLSAITSGFLFIVLRGSLLQATGRAVFSFFLIFLLLRKVQPKSCHIYMSS